MYKIWSHIFGLLFSTWALMAKGHFYPANPGQQYYAQQSSQAVFQDADSSFGFNVAAAAFGHHHHPQQNYRPPAVQYPVVPPPPPPPAIAFPGWLPWFPTPVNDPVVVPPPNPEYQWTELRPSFSGWNTTYDVPCGSYNIHPQVVAHMHYTSDRITKFPLGPSPYRGPGFNPYENKAKSCAWNFQAVGDCQLKFSCSWFQLPALFSCDENVLELSEGGKNSGKRFCGKVRPNGTSTTSSNQLRVNFRTQYHALPSIFHCAVECAPKERQPATEPPTKPVEPQEPSDNGDFKLRHGQCKCGIRGPIPANGRIIGGHLTNPGEFPWTVAVVKRNSMRPFCGGTLINNRYIVTAAHCVQSRKLWKADGTYDIQVLINEHDISKGSEIPGGTVRTDVNQIIVHPLYENGTYNFDLALLRIKTPIQFPLKRDNSDRGHFSKMENQFSSQFVPVCLPKDSRSRRDFENVEGIVTGWGLTREGGVPSNSMMKATVSLFNDTSCQKFYKNQDTVTEQMLCAGDFEGKMDSCVGDSGGPLVVPEHDRYTLAGIVSWGKGCGRPNLPGVYTKILGLTEWIEQNSADAVWCEE